MTTLNQDDVYALEQLRQRLQQLFTSLNSLQNNIAKSETLPQWSSLQSQFSIISNNLQGVSKQLSQYQDLYASTVAFPLPQFPGRTQEVVLQQLLRTRLEPSVDDWIEQGQTVAQDVLYPSLQEEKDLQQFWGSAPITASEEAHKQKWGADYTLAEVQSGIQEVVTGLRRTLLVPQDAESEEDEDEDEEDEEDEDDDEAIEDEGEDSVNVDVQMTGVGDKGGSAATGHQPRAEQETPSMALDHVFRFMMTGLPPSGVHYG